jgi:hypothetical protein
MPAMFNSGRESNAIHDRNSRRKSEGKKARKRFPASPEIRVTSVVSFQVRKRMENLRESAILGNGKSLFTKGLREVFVSLNQRVVGSSPTRGTFKALPANNLQQGFVRFWAALIVDPRAALGHKSSTPTGWQDVNPKPSSKSPIGPPSLLLDTIERREFARVSTAYYCVSTEPRAHAGRCSHPSWISVDRPPQYETMRAAPLVSVAMRIRFG